MKITVMFLVMIVFLTMVVSVAMAQHPRTFKVGGTNTSTVMAPAPAIKQLRFKMHPGPTAYRAQLMPGPTSY